MACRTEPALNPSYRDRFRAWPEPWWNFRAIKKGHHRPIVESARRRPYSTPEHTHARARRWSGVPSRQRSRRRRPRRVFAGLTFADDRAFPARWVLFWGPSRPPTFPSLPLQDCVSAGSARKIALPRAVYFLHHGEPIRAATAPAIPGRAASVASKWDNRTLKSPKSRPRRLEGCLLQLRPGLRDAIDARGRSPFKRESDKD
jgi:hypothetical protein